MRALAAPLAVLLLAGCHDWDAAAKRCEADPKCTPGGGTRVPSAPLDLVATPGVDSAHLGWSPPADPGGSSLIRYTVTPSGGGAPTVVPAPTTQVTVTGLTRGATYTFDVVATNGTGDGPKATSSPVTVFDLPGVPPAVIAMPGNSAVRVLWGGADAGGDVVSAYTVRFDDGGVASYALGTDREATVNGLTNGVAYSFTVAATDSVGEGARSPLTNAVVPLAVPTPPLNVTATAGNQEATVQWEAPLDAGGSPLERYGVYFEDGGAVATTDAGTVTLTVTGLTNGERYRFAVTASNSLGESLPSGLSSAVTPGTVPGAPTAVTADAGDREATVQWAPPADNGGAPLLGYTLWFSDGGVAGGASASATSTTVANLIDGRSYAFTVSATNLWGDGPPSALSNAIIPQGPPLAPVTIAALAADGRATVSWAPPYDTGGLPLVGYGVYFEDGGTGASVGPLLHAATVSGLTNGVTYRFRVRAGNALGNGPYSLPSNDVVPAPPCTGVVLLGGAPLVETGSNPISIASADFNEDGQLDLASANSGSNDLSLALGTGAGTFLPSTTLAAGLQPSWVVASDFNGDKHADLAVVTTGNNSVRVLLGNGDGTFAAPANLPAGTGPTFVLAADVESDGGIDLVTLTSDSVQVRLGNGDGTFAGSVQSLTVPTPHAVVTADFNQDGRYDLALASGDAGLTLVYGGNTGFKNPSTSSLGVSPNAIVAAPLDSDALLDLAVADDGSDEVHVLLQSFSGGLAAAVSYAVGAHPVSLVAEDLDGDGNLDLATLDTNGYLTVLPGKGDGTFLPPLTFFGGKGTQLIAADFNADGFADLAVAHFFERSLGVVLQTRARGVFFSPAIFATGMLPRGIALADFDGDGVADVAVAQPGDNTVGALVCDGAGSLQAQSTVQAANSPVAVASADFDSNGKADLAVAEDINNTVTLFSGAGDGTFSKQVTLPVGMRPRALTAADFDGDGTPDVAAVDWSGQAVSVLLGTGGGAFGGAQSYPVGNAPQAIVSADVNGDGKLDLAVANGGASTVSLLLGNGNGTFQAQQTFGVGGSPIAVAAGDLDGDGKLDLATANNLSGDLSVLLGDGAGGFSTGASYPVGTASPQGVAIVDLDGDGVPDLLTANSGGSVSVLRGNGNGSFQAPVRYTAGSGPFGLAAGDFDRDGKPDVAVVANASSSVNLLLQRGCIP